ncbi:MAG: hypothetical protein VXW65_14530 [Pseudomonadota bacterium]|nr:hypothetical protein [Pseudomonadota bacterium]
MKSRPMIFSAPMVRAILAGQKTQTRRVFKDANKFETDCEPVLYGDFWRIYDSWGDGVKDLKCPYGVVGDRLWVREGYAVVPRTAFARSDVFQKVSEFDREKAFVYRACFDRSKGDIAWETPLFMPRAASRIELEITNIRVERVQDISEADAIAEGVEQGYGLRHVGFYQDIWDSINGKKHPWSDNPWVWVVEFKRVEVSA